MTAAALNKYRRCAFLLGALLPAVIVAQSVQPAQPPNIDYAHLSHLAPWDDRNNTLSADDLALLSPYEAEAKTAIPIFYRVALRRQLANLPQRGPAQYPRSALNRFMQQHGGFLFNGQLYRSLSYGAAGYQLELSRPVQVAPQSNDNAAEQRVSSPRGAQEAAVAIHPHDKSYVIAGTNGPGNGQSMYFSTDGGRQWQASSLPLGDTCCDPAVAWSTDGRYAYAVSLRLSEWHILFYRSADQGRTWSDLATVAPQKPRREIGIGADKEYLHVDTYTDSPYRDRLYLSWHQGTRMRFAYSADYGEQWTTLSLNQYARGLGSDIASDRNGRVYHTWATLGDQRIVVLRSDNGGVDWGPETTVAATQAAFIFPIPATETRQVLISPSIDADLSTGPYSNSVYITWTDSVAKPQQKAKQNQARVQVARSRDGGQSWQVTTPHGVGDGGDRWHPWLKVDEQGRVHLVYYDTHDDQSRRSVHMYYSYSDDGGVTFQPPSRLTTVASPNVQHTLEFGDYNGLDVRNGKVIAIFTDNRDEACNGAESVDVYVSSPEQLRQFACEQIFGHGFEPWPE